MTAVPDRDALRRRADCAPPLSLERSLALAQEAHRLIFQDTHAYSRGAGTQVAGTAPLFFQHGDGQWLTDVDGNRLLDLGAGMGAVVLGHGHADVAAAVAGAVAGGSQASLAHHREIDLARRLAAWLPAAEQMRFFKTGAEAVAAGVRIARAVTRRTTVVRTAYHGWHDWAMAGTSHRDGIPSELANTVVIAADAETFERIVAERSEPPALLCVEPTGDQPRDLNALRRLRQLADRAGALLLVDEVATGFRSGLGGVAAAAGIVPDLAAYGKALANGLPLAALTGRAEILDRAAKTVFVTSTFSGEAVGLAAAIATLDCLSVPGAVARLHAAGRTLRHCFVQDLGGGFRLSTDGCDWRFRPVIEGPDLERAHLLLSLLFQECARRGVLLARVCYPMLAVGHAETSALAAALAGAANTLVAAVRMDCAEHLLDGLPLRFASIR